MSNPWFRLYAEFASDPVVQSLAFEDQRHFIILLCLKCNGTLDRDYPSPDSRDRVIHRGLGLDPPTAAEAKRRLSEVGVIDDSWQPVNWDKRQFLSDTSTDRVRKHRAKRYGNVSVTPPDTEADTEADTERKVVPSGTTRRNGTVPTPFVEIISAYHEILPELPAYKKRTTARDDRMRSRYQNGLGSLNQWRNFFEYVRDSDFLMGRVERGDRPPFRADLEWLCREANYAKILEGKYHG